MLETSSFQVGHVIEAAGVMGKVEEIGIFSTRLKTGGLQCQFQCATVGERQ